MSSAIMDPGASEILPAEAPPPGFVSHFAHPWSILEPLKACSMLIFVLVLLTTPIRIYTKIGLIKRFDLTDYMIIAAAATFEVYVPIEVFAAGKYGDGTHQWDVPLSDIVPFAKGAYICETLSIPILLLTKVSICLQLQRILVPLRTKIYWVIQGFIWVNILYYICLLLITILQCTPIAKIWDPQVHGSCLSYQGFILATAIFNFCTDLAIWTFPLFRVWNLHLSLRKKMSAITVFFLGALAVIASILRIVFSSINCNSPDLTFTLPQVAECINGEIAAGILVSNSLVFPRFFSFVGPKITGLYRSSRTSNSKRDLVAVDSNEKELAGVDGNDMRESGRPGEA